MTTGGLPSCFKLLPIGYQQIVSDRLVLHLNESINEKVCDDVASTDFTRASRLVLYEFETRMGCECVIHCGTVVNLLNIVVTCWCLTWGEKWAGGKVGECVHSTASSGRASLV